jgi:hypothetical protein
VHPALAGLESAKVAFRRQRIDADHECFLERGLRHERGLQVVGDEHREIEQREGASQRPIVQNAAS